MKLYHLKVIFIFFWELCLCLGCVEKKVWIRKVIKVMIQECSLLKLGLKGSNKRGSLRCWEWEWWDTSEVPLQLHFGVWWMKAGTGGQGVLWVPPVGKQRRYGINMWDWTFWLKMSIGKGKRPGEGAQLPIKAEIIHHFFNLAPVGRTIDTLFYSLHVVI